MIKCSKLFLVLFLSAVLIIPIQAFGAETGIMFELSDAVCNTNRLVQIELKAKSEKEFYACCFDFSYDKEMFEFRNFKSDKYKFKYYEMDNCVKIVLLNNTGVNITSETTIANITLKAIKPGEGKTYLKADDCIGTDEKCILNCDCKGSVITVNSGGEDGYSKSGLSAGENNKASDTDDKQAQQIRSSSYDDAGFLLKSLVDNMRYFLPCIILIGILALFLIFVIADKRKSKLKRNDSNDNKDVSEAVEEKSEK